jgi:hypothetical protein
LEKEVLQGYLQKMMTLQDELDHRFTEVDFRIAIDKLGLSDKEKTELDKEFDQQFKQGSNYYRHHNYKKALDFLLVALALEPFHLSTLMLITDCYKFLYLETYSPVYYDKIMEYCKRGLKIQAFNPYFAKVETWSEKVFTAINKRTKNMLIVGSSLLLLSFGMIGINMIQVLNFSLIASASVALALMGFAFLMPNFFAISRFSKKLRNAALTIKFVAKD